MQILKREGREMMVQWADFIKVIWSNVICFFKNHLDLLPVFTFFFVFIFLYMLAFTAQITARLQ